jgi:hypothetical protein
VVWAPDLVRLSSTDCAADSSGEASTRRGAIVAGSVGTSGVAELAVDEAAEELSTGPEGAPEPPGACDPPSAGPGSLGGGAESVLPLAASEPLLRLEGCLLLDDAGAVESPDAAAGTAPEVVLELSTAPVDPAASGAVAGAVVVASVPLETVSEAAAPEYPAVSGVVAGAVVVASVPLEVFPAPVHPAVSGVVAGAVVVASAPLEVFPAPVHPAVSGVVAGSAVVVVASVVDVLP